MRADRATLLPGAEHHHPRYAQLLREGGSGKGLDSTQAVAIGKGGVKRNPFVEKGFCVPAMLNLQTRKRPPRVIAMMLRKRRRRAPLDVGDEVIFEPDKPVGKAALQIAQPVVSEWVGDQHEADEIATGLLEVQMQARPVAASEK